MILGIDPGLDGAIAGIERGRLVVMIDVPSFKARKGREVDWVALSRACWELGKVDRVFLENPNSRPLEGVSSARKLGLVIGGIQGIAASIGWPLWLVSPAKWKRGMGSDKKAMLALARQHWPDRAGDFFARVKDHNRAEAALLAEWGEAQMARGEAA
ncbi:MAG: hypothetical protein AAFW98_04325 [Pseudomonadota bacterium]